MITALPTRTSIVRTPNVLVLTLTCATLFAQTVTTGSALAQTCEGDGGVGRNTYCGGGVTRPVTVAIFRSLFSTNTFTPVIIGLPSGPVATQSANIVP